MKGFNIYLGGPIAGCTDAEANDWRDAIMTEHAFTFGEGLGFINPMDRDYRGVEGDHTNEIVDLDKREIELLADVLLMYAPKPSVGTSMEILHGFNNGTPSVVVIPLLVPVSPWIRRHATKIVSTTERAMDWILNTFAKEIRA